MRIGRVLGKYRRLAECACVRNIVVPVRGDLPGNRVIYSDDAERWLEPGVPELVVNEILHVHPEEGGWDRPQVRGRRYGSRSKGNRSVIHPDRRGRGNQDLQVSGVADSNVTRGD